MKTSETSVSGQLAELAPYIADQRICAVCETYSHGIVSGQVMKIASDYIELVSGTEGKNVRISDIKHLSHDAPRTLRDLRPA